LIEVRNDVLLETQNKQVPWEHSALRGRFYFNPITQRSKAPEAQPSMAGGIYDGTWLVERHGTSGCSNPNSVLSLIVSNNMVSSPAAVTRPATGNVDKEGRITFSHEHSERVHRALQWPAYRKFGIGPLHRTSVVRWHFLCKT
jgi:hypothetical protein